jgi:hypothetical protein
MRGGGRGRGRNGISGRGEEREEKRKRKGLRVSLPTPSSVRSGLREGSIIWVPLCISLAALLSADL